MKNFTNGSLVFRIWRFDGSGEVLAKFQYIGDAKIFAKAYVDQSDKSKEWFLLVVCDADCEVQTYVPEAP